MIFKRILAAILIASYFFPTFINAQVVPDRRVIAFENTDVFGGDIRSIFETTLDICEQACLENNNCQALTFNQVNGSCFLKSNLGELSTFEGAISYGVFSVPQSNIVTANIRLPDLSFLTEIAIEQATQRAQGIGRQYPLNDISATELELRFKAAMASDTFVDALFYAGVTLSLEDTGKAWLNLGVLAAKVATRNSERRNRLRSLAQDAAINAYLRSENPDERADSMVLLAQVLELRNQGRTSIDALRLAENLVSRESIDIALERAIGLFGFRIIGHQVDNNASRPRICINFNEPLIDVGIEYSQFVRMSSTDLPVEVDGTQLCIDGVTHGETYKISLRAGLPAASGETLFKTNSLSIYVRDRDPSVRFTGRSYVLPMSQNPSIPVVTVNASEIELRLSKIGERNLVPTILSGILGTTLDDYLENEIANQRGELVWSGIGEVNNKLNQDITTALPLAVAIQNFEPGIYTMTARISGQGEPWDDAATQWFIVSDLGIETMLGADGLHVFARSLKSAEPLEAITARLIATNNRVLYETTTNAEGYTVIPQGFTRGEGGLAPAMLQLVSASGDFAFIDLNEPAMDLSDRGVSGREPANKIDIFASFERGAYRPGETVYATILARNPKVIATEGLPLTAVLFRPDGVEQSREILADAGAGGRVFSAALSSSAMRGTWRLEIYADPETSSLKTMRFLVEDFVPERIDFKLDIAEPYFAQTASPILNISANYLYGAPASGLRVEGEIEITTTREIASYSGFQFGLADEPFIEGYAGIGTEAVTNPEGNLSFALVLPEIEPVTQPLQMRATVRMSDGSGRPVERSITRALLPDGPRIGIKPLFEGALREGAEAAFEIVAIDANTNRTEMQNVSWTLSRIEREYQWYRSDGRWNWEPITRKIRIASGDLSLTSNTFGRIASTIDWGLYELKIVHNSSAYTASSYRFNSGWWSANASSDTPDVLEVSLDKAQYNIGDTARLRLIPRNAGKVLVRVVSDRLIYMKSIDVDAGEQFIDVPVQENWGAGAYVIATLIQPMNEAENRNPERAIGLTYAPTDPSNQRLTARFEMPVEITPNGPLVAKLKVENIPEGPVYVTIAAVDIGILNLTGFSSPDPTRYYFGQRRLGMEIRDIYGRLIDGMQGAAGRLRSGGDSALSRVNAPPPTQQLIAYFSGVIEVGADGYATASFDLPSFNGTVRLMAIVWSENRIGQAEYDLLVRDPVVVTTAMPRFLAPGDSSRVQVSITNVRGPVGEYSATVYADGAVLAPSYHFAQVQNLALGEQTSFDFDIVANGFGSAEIQVSVTAPDGEIYAQNIPTSVRANDPRITRSLVTPLAANGGEFSLTDAVFYDLQSSSATGSFALGPLAKFDVAGMLDALDRTTWGGTETQISKAMPLLYLADIAQEMDIEGSFNATERVDTAIEAVLANQTSRGSFGQWQPRSGDLWLDAFATDFLSRARESGYSVPDRAFSQALENLKNELNYASDFEDAGQDIAYALMVLARESQANIGDLRYYADVKADDFATPMALAQLGAALAYIGDQPRADALFAKAYARVEKFVTDNRQFRSDFGSQHRDAAALLALAVDAGSTAVNRAALAQRITTPKLYYSTQERMWQLLAARALIAQNIEGVLVDGTALTSPLVVNFDSQSLQVGPIEISNSSSQNLDGRLTVSGAPLTDQPAMSNGYRIERWLYTIEGEPADLSAINQNQRYVAILRITPEQERRGRLIVSDPLAAGFEIDNPNLLRSGDISKLDWLLLNTPAGSTEFRDDRFVSAFTWGEKDSVQLAYIIRAVSPGSFRQPAASVEDRYRPSLRATTGVNHITILPLP